MLTTADLYFALHIRNLIPLPSIPLPPIPPVPHRDDGNPSSLLLVGILKSWKKIVVLFDVKIMTLFAKGVMQRGIQMGKKNRNDSLKVASVKTFKIKLRQFSI